MNNDNFEVSLQKMQQLQQDFICFQVSNGKVLNAIQDTLDKLQGTLFGARSGGSDSALSEEFKQLKENITTQVETISSNLSSLQSETNQNLQKLSEQIDNVSSNSQTISLQLETVSSKVNAVESNVAQLTETNMPALNAKIEAFAPQLTSVENSISNITEVVIPQLEDKIANSGGGGGENWVEIYDCNSDNPAINWGLPDGLIGQTEVTTNLPNFLLYKKLRIYHKFANHYVSKEFDLSKLAQHIAKLPTAGYWLRFLESDSDTVKYTYASNAAILWKDRVIYKMMFSKTVKTAFPVNKYPIFTDYTSSYCAIQRIEGLLF